MLRFVAVTRSLETRDGFASFICEPIRLFSMEQETFRPVSICARNINLGRAKQ